MVSQRQTEACNTNQTQYRQSHQKIDNKKAVSCRQNKKQIRKNTVK